MATSQEELKELQHKPEIMKYLEALILEKKSVTSKWVSWFCSISIEASMVLLEEFSTRNGKIRPDLDMVYVIVGVLSSGESAVCVVLNEELETAKANFTNTFQQLLYSVQKKNLVKRPCILNCKEHALEIPDDFYGWPIRVVHAEHLQPDDVVNTLEENMMQFFISDKMKRKCNVKCDMKGKDKSKEEGEGNEKKVKEEQKEKGKEKKKDTVRLKELNTEERKRITLDFFKRPVKYARNDCCEVPGTFSSELENEEGTSAETGSQRDALDIEMGETESASAQTISQSEKCENAAAGGSKSKKNKAVKGRYPKFARATNVEGSSKRSGSRKKMRRIIRFSPSGSETSSSDVSDDEVKTCRNMRPSTIVCDDIAMDTEVCGESSTSNENQEAVDVKVYTRKLTSEIHSAEDGFIVTKKVCGQEESKAEDKPSDASASKMPKKPDNRPNPKKVIIKMKQSSLTDFFKK